MQLALPPQADQRSAEILGLVRQTFVAKGFDGASMQDLARAAGMSVGNFYRYFPAKSAIIQGLILRDLADIQRDFAAIIGSDSPMASLRHVMRARLFDPCNADDHALWTEIDAAARRSPDICTAAHQMESTIVANLTAVFAAETGLTQNQAHLQFSASAAFVMVLFKAASCLNCGAELDQTTLRTMILATIDRTLDDVILSARKA
jgi:AcrR family transcriptional regulator